MRADQHLLTAAGLIAEATAEAVRRSGATPVSLRKILRNAKLSKGVNPSGPQDDWPNFSPAPQSPDRQRLYQQDRARRAQQDADARAHADDLRRQQQAVTDAIAANHGNPLPLDHPLASQGSTMRSPLKTSATPEGGRQETAELIRNLHKGAPKSEIGRHFSAAARMVKTDRDLENERQATAKAEAALTAPRKVFIGNHMSLSDPYGDTLRKNDAHPTALEAIAKALSRRPGQLSKVTGMPPQDDDSREDNTTADDGATLASTAAASDRRSSDYNPRATTSQLGPSHAASINRRPSLPPTMDGAATTADPDPARVGAVSADETVDAIKMIHAAGAQPMWSGR